MVRRSLGVLAIVGMLGIPAVLWAHCETMDGPVVTAAKAALQRGEVTPVLKWVRPEDEDEVRRAFDAVIALRTRGSDVRELAERAFFETVVRLHRLGHGVPSTGLKPEGSQAPLFAELDRALDAGSVDAVITTLTDEMAAGVRQRFARVREAQRAAEDNVEAGRAYVAAYVELLHYLDRVYAAATGLPPQHEEGHAAP